MAKLSSRFPIYSRLLSLYPPEYRRRYSEETMQTLADMLDDPRSNRALVWTRAITDLPLSLAKQNLLYAGGIMESETPRYVKRNAAISAVLLLPFFVVVFSRIAQNNAIKSGSVWQSSLYITLVFLPLAAFVLSVFTFLKWSRARHLSPLKSLLDFRRSWLLATIGALALVITLFVPFHDSTHCITGNPIRELHNPSQTWRCIQRD
jgi:hypothetical protein